MDFNIEKKGYNRSEVDAHLLKLTRDYEAALAEQKQRIMELKKQLAAAEKSVRAYREKSSLVTKAIYNAVQKADEIERLSHIKYNQEIDQLKSFHDKWIQYYDRILKKYPLDDDLASASNFNAQMSRILQRADFQKLPIAEAEKQFAAETDRLGETQIGYIKIKTDAPLDEKEDDILREIIPDMDPASSIFSAIDDSLVEGHFDPVDRIKSYLSHDEPEEIPLPDAAPAPRTEEQAAADDYADRGSSGFSFEEALNPKEDLADIMKDLGLLMED